MNATAKYTLTLQDAKAADAWGFNCGPAALCAVTGLSPDQVRPHLGDFEDKRYTNPSLMASALASLGVQFTRRFENLGPRRVAIYPTFGLVRIQWSGPWTKPGVPMRVRYRKTHWIAVDHGRGRTVIAKNRGVFDVNAIASGGWISWADWVKELVPWILKECVPKADGAFWPTHCWEMGR